MGTKYPLTGQQREELAKLLDERYARIIEAIAAGSRDDLQGIRAQEEVLAEVPPEDPAFAYVTRLRCYWRLKVGGPDHVALAKAAIEIADADGPYVNSYGLAWFRTTGGILGQEPFVALATVQDLAEQVREFLDGEKPPPPQATLVEMVNTLQFCRREIDDPARLEGAPEKRYLEVREFVDGILGRFSN
jgi:hypothetical protein